jgi:predicted CopG family antitoxin
MEIKLQRGRKNVDVQRKHVCKTISICPQNYEKIKLIGKGNFSEGVRQLLESKEKNGD